MSVDPPSQPEGIGCSDATRRDERHIASAKHRNGLRLIRTIRVPLLRGGRGDRNRVRCLRSAHRPAQSAGNPERDGAMVRARSGKSSPSGVPTRDNRTVGPGGTHQARHRHPWAEHHPKLGTGSASPRRCAPPRPMSCVRGRGGRRRDQLPSLWNLSSRRARQAAPRSIPYP